MPAGSLSAPPVITPGPAARRMSPTPSRFFRGRLARTPTSPTGSRLGGHGDGPEAARLLLEQLAQLERVYLIGAKQQDSLPAVQRTPHLGLEVAGLAGFARVLGGDDLDRLGL